MFIVLLFVCIQLSIQTEIEYKSLGRPCKVNHCDNEHVCVRRKDVDLQYRCIPKTYFKQHPDNIAEWNLNPSLMDEIVDATKCKSCLSEPLDYVCGTDGRVYRSPCYVEYFKCLLDIDIRIACNKECPCNDTNVEEQDKEWMDSDVEEDVNSDPLADDSPDDPRGRKDKFFASN